MPDVLDPHVGASREEQPVYWDEEEANHVAGQSDADEKYWKSLKRKSLDKQKYHWGVNSPILDT